MALFLVALVAWACRRKNGNDPIKFPRYVAAFIALILPCVVAIIIRTIYPNGYMLSQGGVVLSVLFIPLWALVVSYVVALPIRHKSWWQFYPTVVGGLILLWFLALLTEEGVRPFFPLSGWRLHLGIIHTFDYIIMSIALIGTAVGLLLRGFQRDIARITLGLIILYIVGVGVLQFKAYDFARDYAKVMELKDPNIDILAQPLSPFNWRIIIRTADSRLHDSMVNVVRDDEIIIKEGDSRALRIQALYKPFTATTWRVYDRFGGSRVSRIQYKRIMEAWQAWAASPYAWYGRYAVFVKFYKISDNNPQMCIMFRDLRVEGARKPARGEYTLCPSPAGTFRLYRGNKSNDLDDLAMLRSAARSDISTR